MGARLRVQVDASGAPATAVDEQDRAPWRDVAGVIGRSAGNDGTDGIGAGEGRPIRGDRRERAQRHLVTVRHGDGGVFDAAFRVRRRLLGDQRLGRALDPIGFPHVGFDEGGGLHRGEQCFVNRHDGRSFQRRVRGAYDSATTGGGNPIGLPPPGCPSDTVRASGRSGGEVFHAGLEDRLVLVAGHVDVQAVAGTLRVTHLAKHAAVRAGDALDGEQRAVRVHI